MVTSIIICTQNRAESLRRTLKALANINIPQEMIVELIVVDNASDDHTHEVINSAVMPFEVTLLNETRKGLSFARNTGLGAARGDIIVFTDDDVVQPVDWLRGMCMPILLGRAHAVAGGVVIPTYLQRPWMESYHLLCLASTNALHVNFHGPGTMIGANMAFTRKVLEKVPLFDCELGAGTPYTGEETLFACQIMAEGYRIVAAFDVAVEHHFDILRLSRSSLISTADRQGRFYAYMRHHWLHQTVSSPQWRFLKCFILLWCWRFVHFREHNRKEGASETEMLLVKEMAFHNQYILEIPKPRKYHKIESLKRSLD